MNVPNRVAYCPFCMEPIRYTMQGEWQGEGYWKGFVEYLDEYIQSCSCPLSDREIEDLFLLSEAHED